MFTKETCVFAFIDVWTEYVLLIAGKPIICTALIVDELHKTSLSRISAGVLTSNPCRAREHQCFVWSWLWEATNYFELIRVHFEGLLVSNN